MNKKKTEKEQLTIKKKRGERSGIDVISVHVYFGTTSAARPGAPLHIYVHLAECIYTANPSQWLPTCSDWKLFVGFFFIII